MNSTTRKHLAAYAHNAWAGWMNYLFEKSTFNPDGTVTIPAWAVARWQRQAQTPYDDLPGTEQASDLSEADTIISLISPQDAQ